MTTHVFRRGHRLQVSPTQAIGKGGEADIYDLGSGEALKLFKGPDHPDYAGSPADQDAARERLALHQDKLRAFPSSLPGRVVAPADLVTDQRGRRVLGYTMPLITGAEVMARWSEPAWRSGVGGAEITATFLDLHATVMALHRAHVVIGDANDLNILVRNGEAWLIDTDSFQFGRFPCRVFTWRFADPLLCREQNGQPAFAGPFGPGSDWYAFAVLLFQSLLAVHPFGGVHRPAQAAHRVPADLRPLRRLTVQHADVRYPAAALPLETIPDDLLQRFHRIFAEEDRAPFPPALLQGLFWQTCAGCGLEHARPVCPRCRQAAPSPAPAILVRNRLLARRLLRTIGEVVALPVAGGGKAWIVHEGDAWRREDGSVVLAGPRDPRLRFGILGPTTLVGTGRTLLAVPPRPGTPARLAVDVAEGIPQFGTTSRHLFRLEGGLLLREGPLAPTAWGQVLAGQTRFWVGETFGFGVYRAERLHVAFVFNTDRPGLNDRVKVPPIPGQLVGARCCFGDGLAWFFAESRDHGRLLTQCVVVRADGEVLATWLGPTPDQGWAAGLDGKAAIGRVLFALTAQGLVRLEVQAGQIVETRRFPDTEALLPAGRHLVAGPDGLYAADSQSVWQLQLDPARP